MKTGEIIVISAIGIGAYLYFTKKNATIDATSLPTTAQSMTSAYLPESSAIKAADVIIPQTANILPTASLIVQSSSIQEEDINSLDCASLFLKYDTVNRQLTDLVSLGNSNTDNINLLKNRKSLIEGVMKNKNCTIADPVLQSSIIESKIIAPAKYTNAEISQIASTAVETLATASTYKSYAPLTRFVRPTAGVKVVIQSAYENYQKEQRTYFEENKYYLTTKLEDFLKTLPTIQDVDNFMLIYPTLVTIKAELYLVDKDGNFPITVNNEQNFEEAKLAKISSINAEFLNKIGFKSDYIF